MTTKTYTTYEEAAADYLAQFDALLETPTAVRGSVTRGAGDLPAEALIERAGQIADISASMVPLAADYLDATDMALREGISSHLLAQAAAELQVATELLQIAADEAAAEAEPTISGPRPVTHATRRTTLRDAITGVEQAMAQPVSVGLPQSRTTRRAIATASTPEEAKKALQQTAALTTRAISQQVVEVGGDLAFNLVFSTEWTAVIGSLGLASKDIAKLLDRIKEGASALVQCALAIAAKTILNVYNKILILLGNDVEEVARKKIKIWLDDIQKSGKIEIFEQLVGKLYRVDVFIAALPSWLEGTSAEVDKINETTTAIAALSDKFTILVGYLNSACNVIGLTKFLEAQFPQVLTVTIALRIVLLAVLVYAGYDYIGYEQHAFLNLTQGVGETIRVNLRNENSINYGIDF